MFVYELNSSRFDSSWWIKKRKINIKNYSSDDINKTEDSDLDNTLIDQESHKNILVHNISYKTLIDAELLHIIFVKIGRLIRLYDRTRYLVLFRSEKYDSIYNKIRYVKSKKWYRYVRSVKSIIRYIMSRNYSKMKVDSLPLEKTMTFLWCDNAY